MALAIFPELQGLAWNVIRRPKGSTSVEDHTSGRSTRVGYWADPMYEWDLTYDLLRDFRWLSGIQSEMRRLQGFFLGMQGKLKGFLYRDPTDNFVKTQFLGTTDGNPLSAFPLVRSFGDPGYPGAFIAEPFGAINETAIGNAVYLDGIPQTPVTDFLLDLSTAGRQSIFFRSHIGAGHTITIDMNYYFYLHFKDDPVDFTKFAGPAGAGFWETKKITLESLRPEIIP